MQNLRMQNLPPDQETPVLIQRSATDYLLAMNAPSCWVTVGNVSVYIRQFPDGVEVELYPHGLEIGDEVLDYVSASFQEAAAAINTEEKYDNE